MPMAAPAAPAAEVAAAVVEALVAVERRTETTAATAPMVATVLMARQAEVAASASRTIPKPSLFSRLCTFQTRAARRQASTNNQ